MITTAYAMGVDHFYVPNVDGMHSARNFVFGANHFSYFGLFGVMLFKKLKPNLSSLRWWLILQGSASQPQSAAASTSSKTFFSGSTSNASVGGKASLQPKRAPVSNDEIEAILFCWVDAFDRFGSENPAESENGT
ncbi:hypothetical protein Sjap_005354 [Stephania japonica]|uniref:Uncharacterized protein n=1 Tax=Stephania japonica TaxID=461633 RepID=A0AAP0PLS1_9MAGN